MLPRRLSPPVRSFFGRLFADAAWPSLATLFFGRTPHPPTRVFASSTFTKNTVPVWLRSVTVGLLWLSGGLLFCTALIFYFEMLLAEHGG